MREVVPTTYIVDLQEVYGGTATFSHSQHGTSLTLDFADWEALGRPGTLWVTPQQMIP